MNPSLPLAKVRTLNDVYRRSMARTSFALVLLGIAGAMALTLAIVGVYGVLAYAAAQRRREVSIRLALGAEPRALKWLFVRKGLILNCVGGIVGLALAMVCRAGSLPCCLASRRSIHSRTSHRGRSSPRRP